MVEVWWEFSFRWLGYIPFQGGVLFPKANCTPLPMTFVITKKHALWKKALAEHCNALCVLLIPKDYHFQFIKMVQFLHLGYCFTQPLEVLFYWKWYLKSCISLGSLWTSWTSEWVFGKGLACFLGLPMPCVYCCEQKTIFFNGMNMLWFLLCHGWYARPLVMLYW